MYNNLEFIIFSPTREQFESSKNDYTKLGIITETNEFWVSGNYYPLVTLDEYLKKEEAAKLELPNPKPLTIQINNLSKQTYKGDAEANLTIYAPTKIGKNNQVVKCRDGVMADWDYVKWSEIEDKPDVINFAKDLTGVLLATPEEFTYRPSARDTSIRDGGAIIRRIKGNTTVWGQCCKNPYLELDKIYNKNQSNASYTNTNGALRITYNSVGNPQGYYLFSTLLANLVKGHIYMVSIDARVSSGLNVEMELYPNYDTVLVFHPNEEWNRYAALYTLTRNTFNNYYYVGINKSSTTTVNAGDYFEFRNAQFIDLTNIFGAGNEPKTYEAFKAIYPDIYPYCEPTIRNVKTTAIETVGFNLFNGEYADLIGGKTYYVGGSDITGLTFTPQGSSTSFNIVLSTDRTFTPTQSGRLYSTKVNTCVHFQHSGIKDGECADYVKHTLELPEIAEYFPNGMNGIGDVYDEINSKNAVTRIGVVNLGKLNWGKYSDSSTNTVYVARDLQGATGKRTGKTAKYSNTTTAIADMPDKTMLTRTDYPTYIYICDNDYSSLDEFKSAIQGVYLYYELAEPEIRPILEPIQLVYDVEDFGTERAVSSLPSAPFRADIVYQFNAEGRIRDNGRNIERLEKSTNILNFNIEGLKGRFEARFDNEFVVANGIEDDNDNCFYLPSTRSSDQRYNLASEQYVINNIPTEVATATQIRTFEYTTGITPFIPNIMYECSRGLADNETVPIPLLSVPQDSYDHVWMIRFPAIGVSNKLSYPFNIRWKDGTAPRFTTACTLELYFKKIGGNVIIGEWKIYR